MPHHRQPPRQQAALAFTMSFILLTSLTFSAQKAPMTFVHERHTARIVQQRAIAESLYHNLRIFEQAYEDMKAKQRAEALTDNLQAFKARELEIFEAKEARKAEEARINRVDLPLRDSYWISDEYWAISGIRGYAPHTGLDFAIGPWAPIYPVAKGEVVFSGWGGVWGGCGYWTAVRHHDLGVDTVYCHQIQEPPVAVGQWVDPDTIIGYVGSTGLSTGAHLHFGVHPHGGGGWNGGDTTDPRAWLNSYGINP